MEEKTRLTTAAGAPVVDNQNVQTAGPRGPMLLQDVWFLEKLAHFDREVIPERRMHAKGSAAYGTFTVTHDITPYTRAKIFSQVGKKTDMFLRFSTVAGERGAADAERDIRGFSMRFYTEQGNWDLVGNNTPVFYLRDPLKFPDPIVSPKSYAAARAVDQFSCLTAYHRISAIHPLIITYSGVATRRLRAPITALKKLRPALPLIAVLL